MIRGIKGVRKGADSERGTEPMSDSPVTNDSQAAFNASTASSAENATTAGARRPLPDRPWFAFMSRVFFLTLRYPIIP